MYTKNLDRLSKIDSVPFCLLEEQEQMPLLLASLHTSSQTDLPFSVYEVYVCWRVPQKSKLLKAQKR